MSEDPNLEWYPVARLDELPTDGCGLSIAVGRHQVALFHVDGEIHAIDDSCPHLGGSLGLGVVLDGEVSCPWHSFHFCLRTGRNTDGLDERVRVRVARVDEEGRVVVGLPRVPDPGQGGK